MIGKKYSSGKDAANDDKLIVTVSLSRADAERLKKAFDEGKLKQFGLTDVSILPIESTDPTTEKWAKGERGKRRQPRDDETPPLP
jgi:hypothetical protein